MHINGSPGLLVGVNGEIDGVIAVRAENGHVTGVYHVRNPHKLSHLEQETTVTRTSSTSRSDASIAAKPPYGSPNRSSHR
ncbi:hypothetical protein ACBR40_26700 [Nonomuraea sp. AD125B]|uniref:hypothetical protein n=1 Tax=Nonomuraea sp. AD125B TaxID=3242897 RepID=UPI0035298648